MEKSLLYIVDFWIYWSQLAKLTCQQINTDDWKVTWTLWSAESPFLKYEKTIFGFPINIQNNKRKREKKEEEKAKNLENSNSLINEQLKVNLEWQIWNSQVDSEKNLQWLFWSKNFCFDCLINWLYLKQTCPNCSKKLCQQNIRPNKDLITFIALLNSELHNKRKSLCIKHDSDGIMYWNTCSKPIWAKCIISKKHNKHEIFEIEDIIKNLKKRMTSALFDNKSALERRQNKTVKAIFFKQINGIILDGIFSRFDRSLIKFKTNLKNKLKLLHDIVKKLKSANISIDQEKEDLFKSFKETSDLNLVGKVNQSLNEIIKEREENDILLEQYNQEIDKSAIKITDDIDWKIFFFSASDLFQVKETTVSDSSIWLTLHKEKADSDAKLYANFDEEGYSQMFFKAWLDENNFWYLQDDNTKRISSNSDSIEIGTLKLKDYKLDIQENDKIKITLFHWKFDENICSQVHKMEEQTLEFLTKDMKERANNQYKSSSDEEEESDEGNEGTKNEEESEEKAKSDSDGEGENDEDDLKEYDDEYDGEEEEEAKNKEIADEEKEKTTSDAEIESIINEESELSKVS